MFLGWNSWNYYGCDNYNYTVLHDTVDAFFTSGLYDAGYRYLVSMKEEKKTL